MKSDLRKTFLACLGDATNLDTWSSTPFHLLAYGMQAGFMSGGLRLNPHARSIRTRRIAWLAGNFVTGGGTRGFQYSRTMLNALWRDTIPELRGHRVINNFNFFPPSIIADDRIEKWFYVDGTLQLLRRYYGNQFGTRVFVDAIRREREGYESARCLIAFCRFTADSLIADYGLDASRVHVVVPGANIAPADYERWEAERSGDDQPVEPARRLRLVFVGRDVYRKGLDRLLTALAIARQAGLRATLRIVGLSRDVVPPELAAISGVEWCGLVQRKQSAQRWLQLVSECDAGILLSRVDYSPIALREYLALGMVVMGSTTGGCLDMLDADSSIAVDVVETPGDIAQRLLSLERDVAGFERMRARARWVRRSALWSKSVRQLQDLDRHPRDPR